MPDIKKMEGLYFIVSFKFWAKYCKIKHDHFHETHTPGVDHLNNSAVKKNQLTTNKNHNWRLLQTFLFALCIYKYVFIESAYNTIIITGIYRRCECLQITWTKQANQLALYQTDQYLTARIHRIYIYNEEMAYMSADKGTILPVSYHADRWLEMQGFWVNVSMTTVWKCLSESTQVWYRHINLKTICIGLLYVQKYLIYSLVWKLIKIWRLVVCYYFIPYTIIINIITLSLSMQWAKDIYCPI